MKCIYCHGTFAPNQGDADDSLCGACVRNFGGPYPPSTAVAHGVVARIHHRRIIDRHKLGRPIPDLRP